MVKLNKRQIGGIITVCLSGLILLCLFTNAYIFGIVGKTIFDFFVGVFGLSCYPLFIVITVIGSMMIANKRIVVSAGHVINFIMMYFLIVLLVHTMTSQSFVASGNTYVEYLSTCYNFSASLLTFGGIAAAVFVYPLCNTLMLWGTYILIAIGIVVTVVISIGFFSKRSNGSFISKYFVGQVNDDKRMFVANVGQQAQQPVFVNNSAQQPIEKPQPLSKPMQELYGDNLQPTNDKQEDNDSIEKARFTLFGKGFGVKKPIEAEKPSEANSSYLNDYQKNLQPSDNTSTSPTSQFINGVKPIKVVHGDDELSVNPFFNQAQTPVTSVEKPATVKEDKYAKIRSDYYALKGKSNDSNSAPIINGDELSGQLKEQNPLDQRYISKPKQVVAPVEPTDTKQVDDNTFEEGIGRLQADAIDNEQHQVNLVEEDLYCDTDEDIDDENVDNDDIEEVEHANEDLSNVVESLKKVPFADSADDDIKDEVSLLHHYPPYIAPTFDLLQDIPIVSSQADADEQNENEQLLEDALAEFKIEAQVVNTVVGPTVTRYELQLARGIPVKNVKNVADDIAMKLSSIGGVRIEAPIPGKSLFGIEVPNKNQARVCLRSVLQSPTFYNAGVGTLKFGLGIDIGGNAIIPDIATMPHILIAGATGTGKSVCMNTLLVSLMFKYSPEDLRFILVDPKYVEFYAYNDMPHLMLKKVITDPDKAINAFDWLIGEMERRFMLFNSTSQFINTTNGEGVNVSIKDINDYNRIIDKNTTAKLPRIVLVVDELSDLLSYSKNDIEQRILRLSAKARAAGIHLILATQRPSVDVLTGTIKANLPYRVALKVSAFADSKTILDQGGAEKLVGKGDMLYKNDKTPDPIRLQGAFLSTDEIMNVVNFIKANNEAYYDPAVNEAIFKVKEMAKQQIAEQQKFIEDTSDPLLYEALQYVCEAGQASISMVQRRFSIGYNRAGKIIDDLERKKYISGFDGMKTRHVLITKDECLKIIEEIK